MTRKTCSSKDAVNRLAECVEKMVEISRTMMIAMLDQQRKILDRALSVADYGLDARRAENDLAAIQAHRAVQPHANGRMNLVAPASDPKPDIFIPDGDPNG